MTAQPVASGPDTGSCEVIHLGGRAAVVVPVADFLRLRALEQAAPLKISRTPRRYWSGGPGTLLARRRLCPRMRYGADSACPGELADRLRRTSDQPGSRFPRRPPRADRNSWTRSTGWLTIPDHLERFPTGHRTYGACVSAGTGSCTRSPKMQWRSGISRAASPGVDRRFACPVRRRPARPPGRAAAGPGARRPTRGRPGATARPAAR
jgi:hypothetical protein